MTCQVCQKEIAVGATTCPNCGHAVVPASPSAVTFKGLTIPGSVGTGGVIGQGFKIWFRNFGSITKIVLAVWLPIELVKNYLIYAAGAQDSRGLYRIEGLLAEFVGTLVTGAVLFGVVESIRTGTHPSLRACYKWGFDKWGAMIKGTVSAGIRIFLGLLLLAVPGIIFWIWYAFVEQVVIVEGVSSAEALRRSKELSKGQQLKLLGLGTFFLGYCVVAFVLGIMVSGFFEGWAVATALDCFLDVVLVLPNLVLLVFYLQLQQKRGITLDANAASA